MTSIMSSSSNVNSRMIKSISSNDSSRRNNYNYNADDDDDDDDVIVLIPSPLSNSDTRHEYFFHY
jgi:hypothetical protein